MAFCTKCGKKLAEGARFCFECGAAVPATDQSENSPVESGDIEIGISVLLNNDHNEEYSDNKVYLEHSHKTILVSVPNRISVGEMLRIRGQGNATKTGKTGDLLLHIDHIDYKESSDQPSVRKVSYEGEILKCPNCGETLKAFEINCPACGYELRGVKVSSAIKEFALKLESIELRREYEKPRGLFATVYSQQQLSKTDEQKISLIKSFSVPNSKEDMLEFMILATSSMNMRTYDSVNTDISKSEKEVNAAWFSKVQQVYEKAKRSYSTDSIFTDIKALYDNCNEEIKKAKKKGLIKWILLVGWIPLLWIILIVFLSISEPKEEARESQRLANIVFEVQEALDNEEYKLALRIADSIDYQRYDVEMERKWDIQKEYWVDKVLEEATKKGIDLEYTPSSDVDKANDEPNVEDSNSGFVEGFKEGLQPGLDAAKENVEEFNRILYGEEATDDPNKE